MTIHQIWYNEREETLPWYCVPLIESWKENHPQYHYRLWTYGDIDTYMENVPSNYKMLFNRFKFDIQRIDFFKYILLFYEGGLYVDLDYECIKSVESLIKEQDNTLVIEKSEGYMLGNGFLYARKKSKFLQFILQQCLHQNQETSLYNDEDKLNTVLKTTGPLFLTKCYHEYCNKSEINVVQSKYLSPLNVTESREILRSGRVKAKVRKQLQEAFAIHYFFTLWLK